MLFFVLEYLKSHLPGLYCLKKKVGKMSLFGLFKLVVFIAQEGVFSVLKYLKRHFPSIYCLKKKKIKKWPFLHQNHGLTPLQKCQLLDFFNFLFLYVRKALFRSRIS